jgi:hypothetical protein
MTESKETLVLKIIDWAQKHNKKLENLTLLEVILAVRTK